MEAFTKTTNDLGHIIMICISPNKLAVTELSTEIEHLCSTPEPAYLLVDFHDTGALPIAPFSRKIEDMLEQLCTNDNLRVAIVLRDSFLRDIAQSTLETMTKRRFMQYFTNESKATHWLQQEAELAA